MSSMLGLVAKVAKQAPLRLAADIMEYAVILLLDKATALKLTVVATE